MKWFLTQTPITVPAGHVVCLNEEKAKARIRAGKVAYQGDPSRDPHTVRTTDRNQFASGETIGFPQFERLRFLPNTIAAVDAPSWGDGVNTETPSPPPIGSDSKSTKPVAPSSPPVNPGEEDKKPTKRRTRGKSK